MLLYLMYCKCMEMAKRIRNDGREAIDDPTLTAFQLHISAFRPVSRVHSDEAQKAGTDPNRGEMR